MVFGLTMSLQLPPQTSVLHQINGCPFAKTQLTSVLLVLRGKLAVDALSHVVAAISAFLDPSGEMPLARACSFNSIRLLDHIWARSCVSPADKSSGWSRFNWLRSDPVYYRWQFEESVAEAVRCGHLGVIQWLFVHFQGCKTTGTAVEKAARNNHFTVLRLLYLLDRRYHGERDRDALRRLNEVKWGLYDMPAAARHGRGDVVRWLFGNSRNAHSPHRLRTRRCYKEVSTYWSGWSRMHFQPRQSRRKRARTRDTLAVCSGFLRQLDGGNSNEDDGRYW
jgi:hypothetical protein